MQTGKVSVILGVVVATSLGSWGCATKKHVREAIAPQVQDQVNTVQKQTGENKTAIGDLDRQVATADEKATDAGKRAGQAMDAPVRLTAPRRPRSSAPTPPTHWRSRPTMLPAKSIRRSMRGLPI